jgi:hypothetical protein
MAQGLFDGAKKIQAVIGRAWSRVSSLAAISFLLPIVHLL